MNKIILAAGLILLSKVGISQVLTPYLVDEKNQYSDAGYKDENGNIVIKPNFWNNKNFTDGYAKVVKDGDHVIIDTKGTVIVNGSNLSEDKDQKRIVLESVLKNENILLRHPNYGSFCIVSKTGELIKNWTEGEAKVIGENKEYLIHTIKTDIAEGERKYDTKTGIINFEGKTVLEANYTELIHVKNTVFIACKGKWTIFDEKESMKIAKSCMSPVSKKEEWRAYQLTGNYGIIDISGKEIIPFEYKYMSLAKENIIGSKVCSGWNIILQDNRGYQGSRNNSFDGLEGTQRCNEIKIQFSELGL